MGVLLVEGAEGLGGGGRGLSGGGGGDGRRCKSLRPAAAGADEPTQQHAAVSGVMTLLGDPPP